jgi:hypothetical protein
LLALPALLVIISNLLISQEWQNYYAYNNLRQEIVNTTRTVYIQQNIEKSGWDQGELFLFDNFSFADQETFNKSQLDFLVDFSSSSQGFLGLLNPVVSVEDRLVNLKRYNGLILTFLILPIGLLIANSRQNYSNYIFHLSSLKCDWPGTSSSPEPTPWVFKGPILTKSSAPHHPTISRSKKSMSAPREQQGEYIVFNRHLQGSISLLNMMT